MREISSELIDQFRPPGFPSSFFISFEGIEGSGKSTQIVKLRNYLEEKGMRVLTFREPGGTPFGEKLRSAILESQEEISPLAEAHLFAASRAQLFSQVLLKELHIPKTIIICDRFLDSSIAYQGIARKLGAETILEIHRHFPLHLVPHLTLYLKVDIEISYQRQEKRQLPKDYFEKRDDQFHLDLIRGYDTCAKLFPQRIRVLDGTRDLNSVHQKICHYVDEVLFQA